MIHRLMTAAAMLFVILASPAARGAGIDKSGHEVSAWRDPEIITHTQADRLKNPKTLDILIFPSYVNFDNVSAKWNDSCALKQTLDLAVKPVVITDAPEDAAVSFIFADVTTDAGKTWRYIEFREDSETGEWSALVDFPDWRVATGAFSTGSAAMPSATDTAKIKNCDMEIVSSGGEGAKIDAKKENTAKENPDVEVVFWAMDSLGNITTQMYRQTEPESEKDVRFAPLIIDAAEPGRNGAPDYQKSPDRDILNTAGAWLRNSLLFRMKIAGTTVSYNAVQPALNYYIIRFVHIYESSFRIQLGTGLYHYHKLKRKHAEIFDGAGNESFPFSLQYDPLNLFQLGSIIEAARAMPEFPPIFDDFMDQLEEEDLVDALEGKTPAPLRKTEFDTGIKSNHLGDRIYWSINLDTFTEDEEADTSVDLNKNPWEKKEKMVAPPQGLIVRFYTGYKNTEESSNVIRDDMTAYSTILFKHLTFTRGVDVEMGDAGEASGSRPWMLVAPEREAPEKEKPKGKKELVDTRK